MRRANTDPSCQRTGCWAGMSDAMFPDRYPEPPDRDAGLPDRAEALADGDAELRTIAELTLDVLSIEACLLLVTSASPARPAAAIFPYPLPESQP